MSVRILIGDCRDWMAQIEPNTLDACVCDPPYHLTSIVKRFGATNAAPAKVGKTGAYERASRGFMGQTWDGGDVAFDPATWEAVYRVLKPGAHLIAFSGTRTYHRMACAIEDAGFEIRDQLAWCYGSGFPKSHNVGKGIEALNTTGGSGPKNLRQRDMGEDYRPHDLAGTPDYGNGRMSRGADTDRDYLGAPPITDPEAAAWQGWGTALKPAWEPICLARKPLESTVAKNVLKHGTGALNIDGCRIETADDLNGGAYAEQGGRNVSPSLRQGGGMNQPGKTTGKEYVQPVGRWPANIIHDGSDEVLAAFPESYSASAHYGTETTDKAIWGNGSARVKYAGSGDAHGSAARFFYCAKATTEERGEGNNHPTVKPIDLMRWLCRLITPPGGTVLDPFMGSGSTLIAADAEQFNAIGCELSPEYASIAEQRIRNSAGLFAEVQVECLAGDAA